MLDLKKISLGKRVRIFPGIRLEAHGENALILIEDNVGIGQNAHITAMGKLVIREESVILGNTFITDIEHCYSEPGVPVLEQPMVCRRT